MLVSDPRSGQRLADFPGHRNLKVWAAALALRFCRNRSKINESAHTATHTPPMAINSLFLRLADSANSPWSPMLQAAFGIWGPRLCGGTASPDCSRGSILSAAVG